MDTAAWLALVAAADGVCRYCGKSQPLTMDHRVPLSRGGRHEIANLIPACKPCNSRKHTRTEEEFRALLDSERGLSEEEYPYRAPPSGAYPNMRVADRDMVSPRVDILVA